jgi:hypothetical protein
VSGLAGLPAWTASLLHGLLHWPAWAVAAPLAVVAVAALAYEDLGDQRATRA